MRSEGGHDGGVTCSGRPRVVGGARGIEDEGLRRVNGVDGAKLRGGGEGGKGRGGGGYTERNQAIRNSLERGGGGEGGGGGRERNRE